MNRVPMAALLLSCCLLASFPARSATDGATAGPPAAVADSGQGRAEAAGRALIGKPAPAAVVRTIDGRSIDLGKLYGHKPVYLKFWATWCVPCREQMPAFERDYEAVGDRIAVVAVNTGFNESVDAIEDYRVKHGLRMPIVVDDGRLAAALNLRVTPQHVVIGRDGRVLYVGHLEDARLHQALEGAMGEAATRASPANGATGSAVAAEPTFKVGDAPRGLSATTLDGKAFPLTGASEDGAVRALVFFSPWCESYFADSRPAMSEACRRMREQTTALMDDHGVRWLGIASGLWASPADLREFQAESKVTMPLVLDADGRLFRAFDVRTVPTVILIDRQGRIVRRLGPETVDVKAALATLKPSRRPS